MQPAFIYDLSKACNSKYMYMIMEERNLYETVGSHNQGASLRYEQRSYNDGKMYMVPNTAQLDEELQISRAPSKKQSANQHGASLSTD